MTLRRLLLTVGERPIPSGLLGRSRCSSGSGEFQRHRLGLFGALGPGAGAERQPFQKRIAPQPICTVQSRATGFPTAQQAVQACAAPEVHITPRDHVMGRRVHRDQIFRRIEILNSSQSLASWGKRSRNSVVAGDGVHPEDVRVVRRLRICSTIAGLTTSGGPARPSGDNPSEAVAVAIDQICPFPRTRFGDQRAAAAGM